MTGVIRVGFLTPGFWMGGAERWMLSLAKNFPPDVKLATVVVRDRGDWNPVMRYGLPSEVTFFDGRSHAADAFKDVDVVLSWGVVELREIWDECRAAGVHAKLIDVHHAAANTPYIRLLAKASLETADRIAAVSDACRLQFSQQEWERVTLIPNGADLERVDTELSREKAREQLGIYHDEKMVLYFGRIMPDKNIGCLVDAVRGLDTRYRLFLVGPRKFYDDQELAGWHRRLPNRLNVITAQDSPATFLKAADCFAMASLSEAHPLAVTEAACAGLPTAMFDLPWVKWVTGKIPDEKFIYAATAQNSHALSNAIYRACESPDRQTSFPKFREMFTSRAMANRWAELIREVMVQ